MIIATLRNVPLTCNFSEPLIGIEPMTYALRGACSLTAHALAAVMTPDIALIAPDALGLSGDPLHESVHAPRGSPLCGDARHGARHSCGSDIGFPESACRYQAGRYAGR
jgi:hypothetical protein